MAGVNSNGNGSASGQSGSGRPSAATVARLDGNLTHVLSSSDAAEGLQVFVNTRPIEPTTLESLSVNVIAPNDTTEPDGVLTAILSRYEGGGADGAPRTQRSMPLFPGAVEVVARGRRIVVSCRETGNFDGVWLGLGLRDDGTSTELTGVRSLRIVVSPGLVDARLVWSDDGIEEDLLPD